MRRRGRACALTFAAGSATRTLKAGQAVWNRGKIPRDVVNRTDRPAWALATHLDPGR